MEQVRGASGNGKRASEIMEKIQTATSQNLAVMPVGSGTFSQFGNLPNTQTQTVTSLSLADVIEYDPPNQVITVGAGMSLAVLQDQLKTNNQWLPVRPPFFGSSSTIGSLVALAACGPERMAYGAPRDLLLGLRYIDSRGRQVTAGGRVVKNVAGYDMTPFDHRFGRDPRVYFGSHLAGFDNTGAMCGHSGHRFAGCLRSNST